MKKLYLFQPQVGSLFNNRINYYLPYSVGSIWCYAKQDPRINDNYIPTFIFKRQAIHSLMREIDNPDVAVFSCYLWNWEYNKHVAQLIKEKYPNCLIIFGGPQVTNKPIEKSFFKNHPYVDTIVNGEGEVALQEILLQVLNGEKPKRYAQFSRLTELDYPSPYLSGVFDDLIKSHPEITWMTVLETNRGCPYACTFCDWGSLTYSKVRKFPEQRVLDEITWMSNHKVDWAIFGDANFGILYERDKRIIEHLNKTQVLTGYPKVVSANWAKNGKEKTVSLAKIFFSNGQNRGFTISLQSTNETVLEAIKRKNMDINDLASMIKLCAKEGIKPYTELILGLPHETLSTWKENFNTLLTAGQHSTVEIYLLGLLENSEINTPEQIQQHEIKHIRVPSGMNGSSTAMNINLDEDKDIQEYEYIVTQTKYMSLNDIVDGYAFTQVVVNYHYGGWTQILSRFLHQYKNLSYLQFYSDLEDYIKRTPGVMNTQYYRIRNFIEQMLTGSDEIDQVLKKDFNYAYWRSAPFLAQDQDKLFEELFNFATNTYCQLDPVLYDELVEFQKKFIYNFGDCYPAQKQFNYNFIDYLENGKDLNQPKMVQFDYPFNFPSKENYIDNVYYMRKRHVLRTQPINLT